MGKSSSKLSAESLERLKQPGTGARAPASNYTFNEKELRNWCRGLNKEFTDAQLTDILDNEHLLVNFLTDIFYQEVEVSDSMQTLFRGNCLASKIMSHCFRTFGSKYLIQLLEPHIKPLSTTTTATTTTTTTSSTIDNTKSNYHCSSDTEAALKESPTSALNQGRLSVDSTANIENTAQPNTMQLQDNLTNCSYNVKNYPMSYEIDSTRLEENADIDTNRRNLLRLTKQILDSILSSAASFPPQLNLMCVCLRQVLCEKYPNSDTNLKAVGTVIFLRFINPAIVAPYEAGIVDKQLPPRTMRGLMLVSKILQNIANNVEFSKEDHMLPFNDFVRAHFEPMQQWVSEISNERSTSE